MNKTPVISAGQQRQTLSAKKKPPKVQLKNVLAQPFARYWPAISPAEAAGIIRTLHAVQLPGDDDTPSPWKSSHCIVGLRATLRHIQTGGSDVLLLSADIRPKFIVDQIILLAVGHNPHVRCLLLPGLRQLLATTLGLPTCMCVSLTRIAGSEPFAELWQAVGQLVQQHPVPRTHQRRMLRGKVSASGKQSSAMDVNVATATRHQPRRELPAIAVEELYVKRSAQTGERGFVPAGTVLRPDVTAATQWSDYISLGNGGNSAKKPATINMSAIEQMKRKMKLPAGPKPGSYVTLTVNRVQGNPDKIKRPPQKHATTKQKNKR